MKKFICIFLMILLTAGCFSACGGADADTPELIVTIYPLYDFCREILGDNPAGLQIGLLEKNGVDLHNFQPSAEDIAFIDMAKLFVYIGGESDEWTEAALAEKKDGTSCRMMDAVDTLEEQTVEGMQENEEEEEEEGAADEHIWLSLRNAQKMVQTLCNAICAVDAANEAIYRSNASAYIQKLDALDKTYAEAISASDGDTLLVADRFPFRYLAADYDLTYYAAFSGCAASLDVSFETVAFLSEKLKELDLPVVLTIDGSDGSVAQTVVSSAGSDAKILTLHSCQCVTAQELKDGLSYYDIMRSNLEILKEALGGWR